MSIPPEQPISLARAEEGVFDQEAPGPEEREEQATHGEPAARLEADEQVGAEEGGEPDEEVVTAHRVDRDEQAARLIHHGEPEERPELHDQGELVAAALVRVTSLAPPGVVVPGGWPGARIGVALQMVSAVSWLSAGRARGAA